VQRTYYQPVTTYQARTYCEQVTTYQTSYYYEPCTSYRYTCCYDPCTCSYQQVATPVTTYQLRSQCCPVTSWVQRCCYEPCTSYRQCCYYEPVTTCCQPTCCEPACVPNGTGTAPVVTERRATAAPPVITEQRSTAPPVVDVPAPPAYNGSAIVPPLPEGSTSRSVRPQPQSTRPLFPNTSAPKAPQNNWQPATRQTAPPVPPVKLDRIVVGPNAQVEGRVVRSDNTPRPNAVLTFVSTNGRTGAQTTTANSAGRFRINLASGGWLVYLDAPNGTKIYHSRIEVDGHRPPQVTLVSRQ
jgi:hypothetical protein